MQLSSASIHFRNNMTAICLLLMLGSIVTGCKPLSAAEVDAARKSPDAICKAVAAAYRSQDLKAFAQLAMSPAEIKAMMDQMELPEAARRETIHNRSQFVQHMQDSLQHVLTAAAVDWTTVSGERFVALRKPVEVAPGYKMCIGKLILQAGGKELSQPFTLVEAEGGTYFVGDFGPFEPVK
jgi:hypothetical protein